MKTNFNLDFFAQNKYAIVDQSLAADQLQNLATYIQSQYQDSSLKKAGISRETKVSSSQRGDFIQWLDPATENPTLQYFLNFLSTLKDTLNQEFFLSLKDFESHVTLYPPGAHYEKHIDQFKSSSPLKAERKISFILYLNPNWKAEHGGMLNLFDPQQPEKILVQVEPTWGRFIYFMSDEFPHEVSPTHSANRMSLTAWFLS